MPSMVTEPVNALYRLLNTPKGTMPDPRDPQNQRDAINALMAVYGGNALGGVAKGALGKAASRVRNELDDVTFQSKNATIYPLPNRLQRPFEADYKGQAPATQDGILTHDIEGRPSRQSTWSAEDWWAEKMKPYRQQNMTPYQRHCLIITLKELRRERLAATQVASKSPTT